VPDVASGLWNFATPVRNVAIRRMPTTLMWSAPGLRPGPDGRISFAAPRRHSEFLWHRRFPQFPSSGCFFNGVTQVCFFEPFWSLLCFGDSFDAFDFGFGWGGDGPEPSDDSQTAVSADMSGISQPASPWEDDTAEGRSPVRPSAFAPAEDWDLGKGVFVLVLNNGTSRTVTDYWVADGYLEYVSPDGTRSHIPLDALDLESTVLRNAPRGLAFVLRLTPGQNR
jgi:hypothetical protein